MSGRWRSTRVAAMLILCVAAYALSFAHLTMAVIGLQGIGNRGPLRTMLQFGVTLALVYVPLWAAAGAAAAGIARVARVPVAAACAAAGVGTAFSLAAAVVLMDREYWGAAVVVLVAAVALPLFLGGKAIRYELDRGAVLP